MSNQQTQTDEFYTFKAKVVRVIDGDTIVFDIDLGFGTWIHDEHVRLARINAPETRTKDLNEKRLGLASRQLLEELIFSSPEVKLVTFKDHGKYGRFIADVYVRYQHDWICINDRLVEAGHAIYVEY